MKYGNPDHQRMAKRFAESVAKAGDTSPHEDSNLPMYNDFAASMDRYVDGVLRPFLDRSLLIAIAEARHEWTERKIG